MNALFWENCASQYLVSVKIIEYMHWPGGFEQWSEQGPGTGSFLNHIKHYFINGCGIAPDFELVGSTSVTQSWGESHFLHDSKQCVHQNPKSLETVNSRKDDGQLECYINICKVNFLRSKSIHILRQRSACFRPFLTPPTLSASVSISLYPPWLWRHRSPILLHIGKLCQKFIWI